MTTTDDALDVARFCWPDPSWRCHHEDGVPCRDYMHWPCAFDPSSVEHIAAAERVLVERGMGAAYGAALEDELVSAGAKAPWKSRHEWNAAIRTAPLEVCLRALARVVREREREKQPKETK